VVVATIVAFTVTIWASIEPVIFIPILDGGVVAPIGVRTVWIDVTDAVADVKAVTAGAIDNP